MKRNFRLKIFFILTVFVIIVTATIATIDYHQLKGQMIENNRFQVEQASETVTYALQSIDKAYYFLDQDTNEKIEKNMTILQNKYHSTPNFEQWDFERLAKQLGMDVYIISPKNIVIFSNIEADIGLDFTECCTSLVKILNARRESGNLYIDGIDIEQHNEGIKKYAYMATYDKQYIIELGYNLEDEPIFEKYNFLDVTDDLKNKFSSIEDIRVLNFGGLTFGGGGEPLQGERRKAFESAREKNEIVEIRQNRGKETINYRYIPLMLEYDQGSTQLKMIEISYNEHILQSLLKQYQKTYIIQITILLMVTILISIIISGIFAKPVYLAFHDSLTGLKNRAALDEDLEKILKEQKGTTALLMLDLDNFKLVNDFLGHARGDSLLQSVAKTMKRTTANLHIPYRLGGDEFVIIMADSSRDNAEQLAHKLIENIKNEIHLEKEFSTLNISVSVGIALSEVNVPPKTLMKQADIALYHSKEKGKNQYQIYESDKQLHIPFTD